MIGNSELVYDALKALVCCAGLMLPEGLDDAARLRGWGFVLVEAFNVLLVFSFGLVVPAARSDMAVTRAFLTVGC